MTETRRLGWVAICPKREYIYCVSKVDGESWWTPQTLRYQLIDEFSKYIYWMDTEDEAKEFVSLILRIKGVVAVPRQITDQDYEQASEDRKQWILSLVRSRAKFAFNRWGKKKYKKPANPSNSMGRIRKQSIGRGLYAIARRDEGHTLGEIGVMMNVSKERVRQIIAKGERMMKRKDLLKNQMTRLPKGTDVYQDFVNHWNEVFN